MLARSRMAMLGESMHACPDGIAVADSRPSIAPAGCVGASHDLEIGLRHASAAGVAVSLVATLLSASLALEWRGDSALTVRRSAMPGSRCSPGDGLSCTRKMNATPKASPYKRHKFAARRSFYVAVPDGAIPGICPDVASQ